jgi:hypothetical protein
MMSSPFTHFLDFTIANALHLAGILVLALICVRLLRGATNKLVRPAVTHAKGGQQREAQTRAIAERVYATGRLIIWIVAALTALPEFGISAIPAVVVAGAALLAFSIGARDMIRDVVAGLQIVMEDQFVTGDTIQAGDTVGRVEQLTLRRTVWKTQRRSCEATQRGRKHWWTGRGCWACRGTIRPGPRSVCRYVPCRHGRMRYAGSCDGAFKWICSGKALRWQAAGKLRDKMRKKALSSELVQGG